MVVYVHTEPQVRYKIVDVIDYREKKWMSTLEEKEIHPTVIGQPKEERIYLRTRNILGEMYYFEGQYLGKRPLLVQGPVYYQNLEGVYGIFSPQRSFFRINI